MDQAKNIEMGMGPDAGLGNGVAGRGGYDPYADGLDRGVGAGQAGGDVYDF